eukprot:697473-Rhodomonas_salina.3
MPCALPAALSSGHPDALEGEGAHGVVSEGGGEERPRREVRPLQWVQRVVDDARRRMVARKAIPARDNCQHTHTHATCWHKSLLQRHFLYEGQRRGGGKLGEGGSRAGHRAGRGVEAGKPRVGAAIEGGEGADRVSVRDLVMPDGSDRTTRRMLSW